MGGVVGICAIGVNVFRLPPHLADIANPPKIVGGVECMMLPPHTTGNLRKLKNAIAEWENALPRKELQVSYTKQGTREQERCAVVGLVLIVQFLVGLIGHLGKLMGGG